MNKEFHQLDWDDQLADDCQQLVRLAIREDLDRSVDLTTAALIDAETLGAASFVARESGIAAGIRAMEAVIDVMEISVDWQPHRQDGDSFGSKGVIAQFAGKARDMLTAERILLNLLCKLSGIATMTSAYVKQVSGTSARIFDTRKTTPGWRRLEKYAVRCGGGFNHRTGLFDAVLIKDNHLAIAGRPGELCSALNRAKEFIAEFRGVDPTTTIIEIEVDSLDQFDEVLPACPDIVLLDNMSTDQLREAIRRRDAAALPIELEASGGVNLQTVRAIAETGIDRISVGALTHAARWLDVGLDWQC